MQYFKDPVWQKAAESKGGEHIPFMVTVLLYVTVVLGRPPCFRPVLPWRTRVTVFMPKTAAVYLVKASRSEMVMCWPVTVVTAPSWALTAGISMNIIGVGEPASETEALKASSVGWKGLLEPRTETILRSKACGLGFSRAMEVMLMVEALTADWARRGKMTKMLGEQVVLARASADNTRDIRLTITWCRR
jgi:hypothetical protein